MTITITVNGQSVSYDETPAELAGLVAAHDRVMAQLSPGDGQDADTPVADRPGYIADPVVYLQGIVAGTGEDAYDVMSRCLASWSTEPTPVVAEPATLDLVAYAADKRWRVEVGGTTWDGSTIRTDRDSQSKMIAEFVAMGAGLRLDPSPWKFADGFRSLTNAQMAEVITAARSHVAAAFASEATALVGIEDGTITTQAQVDAVF